MGRNSESRNVGFEEHLLFKVYEEDAWSKERCHTCGSDNIFLNSTWDGPGDKLMCWECNEETEEDLESFEEWCERNGYNPNRLDVIEVFKDSNKEHLRGLINDLNEESRKIVIVGVDSSENI